MAIHNLVQTPLSEYSREFVSQAGGILNIRQRVVEPIVINFANINLTNGEYMLIHEVVDLQKLYDIEIQHEALGANTALSIGTAIFNAGTTPVAAGKYVVNDAVSGVVIDGSKFTASFATTSAKATSSSTLIIGAVGYKFLNREHILIKNTGTAPITTGKLVMKMKFYNDYI